MSTPGGEQPVGQLSPDGQWRWDGHNWVPAQQPTYQQPTYPQPTYQQPTYQAGPPAYQQQLPGPQFPGQPFPSQQYAGMPGMVPPKKGMPTWAKVLIVVLSLVVALMVLLTIVGLTVDEDYSGWSCEDVANEAVRISGDSDKALVLTDVTDLKIVEDHRSDFTTPDSGRGVVLTCEGTGKWDSIDDTPVTVELTVDSNGDEWVRYEMTE
jgi:hypothetical protein